MDYLDASAVVKLVVREPESGALSSFLRGREPMTSSELLLAEVPRALRREAGDRSELTRSLATAARLLEGVALHVLDRSLLIDAGRFGNRHLRALDAVHVVTALELRDSLEAFVSYDRRQLEVVRAAGLETASPGSGDLQ